ncbi:MAG: BMC domain-containing protein [Lachnospiraceae bacterium]|nr:MAG: BMC domain-containing protein [Lachnospiraceae bacterium]
MIETRGVLAAIESADVMLKTANVRLVSKEKVGGGLITVIVEGDVAAVKASVEAGAYAVENLDKSLLVSKHVIPRPVSDVHDLLLADIKELKEEKNLSKDKEEIIVSDKVEDGLELKEEKNLSKDKEEIIISDKVEGSLELKEEIKFVESTENKALTEDGKDFVQSKIELEDTEYVEINSKADFEQARLKADESLLLRSLERLTNPKLKEIILDMDKSCDAKNLAKLSKLKLIEKLMSIPKR